MLSEASPHVIRHRSREPVLTPELPRVLPDETNSNRWNAVFEVTDRTSTAGITVLDDHVAPDGRVMKMLSKHQYQGWLEGYCSPVPRLLPLLRGVRSHRRLDVQPARQQSGDQ